ncbi:MAG TPA: DUF1631 family protein [Usitatibacter sp.]|nr:DUF1631 family protein [Usitatibacter sp.]
MAANPHEALLQECRDLFRDHLIEAVRRTFDGMDESLTALADASKDEEARSRFLAARDMALRHREVIEAQFRRRLMSEFQSRIDKSRQGARMQSFSLEDLQLVGEDDLNETLGFNDMAAKVRVHCDEEMNALDQRAAVLLGKAAVGPDENPFGAKVVADAFKHACQQVDCPVDVRLVFMKSFEKLALDDIRGTCREVNDLLVANAILPRIRYGVARNESKARPASPAPEAANEAPALTAPVAPAQQDMFSMLSQMLAGGKPSGAGLPGMDGGMGVGGMPIVQGSALMGSLTSLQRGDVASLGEAAAELAPILAQAGDLSNVLRRLKDTSVGKGMDSMDAMTLEIVSLLFDALFEDPKVPEALKGEIGRLQLPMLKVAIADKELFSSKEHPARRLLDAFGQLGLRLPAEFGPLHPVFPQVDALVHEVIETFEVKTEVFDTVRGKLEALIAAEDARQAAGMRSTEKHLEQVEGLAVAKSEVRQELGARLAAHPQAPRPVIEFVGEQWIKHLVITRAREGSDSAALREAWRMTGQLLWSVEPKASLEERKKLTNLIPLLLKALKAGIAASGIGDEVARAFFAQLMACHTEALKHHPPAPLKSKRTAEPSAMLAEKLAADKPGGTKNPSPDEVIDLGKPLVMMNPFGGGEVQVSDDDLDFTAMPPPTPTPAPATAPVAPLSLIAPAARPARPSTQIRLPSAMLVGAWVTVTQDDGTERPARLHYVSPLKSHFLFVDRKGEKVYECSRSMLARRISLGEVALIDKEPDDSLFDRIMEGIFGKLKAPLAHAA